MLLYFQKSGVVLTIPNLLTTSRIVMAPFLGYLVLQELYSLSCGLFLLAGFTDLVSYIILLLIKCHKITFNGPIYKI